MLSILENFAVIVSLLAMACAGSAIILCGLSASRREVRQLSDRLVALENDMENDKARAALPPSSVMPARHPLPEAGSVSAPPPWRSFVAGSVSSHLSWTGDQDEKEGPQAGPRFV